MTEPNWFEEHVGHGGYVQLPVSRDSHDYRCGCGSEYSVSGMEMADLRKEPIPIAPKRFNPYAPRPSFTKRKSGITYWSNCQQCGLGFEHPGKARLICSHRCYSRRRRGLNG